tara:strand:+ start:401 stop:937 length:537 start_codon:yes stop_codon:yes gene_type:complete
MYTSNIRIADDVLNETTGVYTCMIYFTDDIDQGQKENFIKTHIISLNYTDLDFVFNPSLGSKVSASRHAENKNQIKLEVQFIKLDITVNLVKSFNKPKPPSYPFPPQPPKTSPPSYKSELRYTTVTNIRDKMWIKELEEHPEYATLNSHPHYTSFQHAILSCTSKQAKENTYKFYCDN